MNGVPGVPSDSRGAIASQDHPPNPPAPLINAKELADIQFTVTKVKYPAERLSRRIQIWYVKVK